MYNLMYLVFVCFFWFILSTGQLSTANRLNRANPGAHRDDAWPAVGQWDVGGLSSAGSMSIYVLQLRIPRSIISIA